MTARFAPDRAPLNWRDALDSLRRFAASLAHREVAR